MDENDLMDVEFNHGKIKDIGLKHELEGSFLSYAMSVIVARAIPDVRDGLKPVQRRILWGMNELNLTPGVAHKKSARIVGDVMGKYHPHGDSSIYEAMVHMAQDFSYRYPLVDGHGNFGNVDGDGAAAMRYTEARMSKMAMEMLRDINKETVPFIDNYDASEMEPEILPARVPNLLINGTTGIAVGMATNIPPHNLGEVIDGTLALIDNPELESIDLMNYIKGPDFPTGGIILGASGLTSAYTTGNGSITIRSKAEILENNGKESIVVTEIPFGVRKTLLIEKIAQLVKDKVIDGITDLRDESNRNGLRIVIELRRDANAYVILNTLYKETPLQQSYGINMTAIVNKRPEKLGLKRILECYIEHQINVITNRVKFDLRKAIDRLEIVNGYVIALDNIDEIINIIRNTTDGSEKDKLMNRFGLSDRQAQAILDMRLKSLSGLSREKTLEEKAQLEASIKEYNEILADPEKVKQIIKDELTEIKNKYKDERRSTIDLTSDIDIDNEDLIPRTEVMLIITKGGYVKRTNLDEFKTQRRGGTGHGGMKTHEDDMIVDSMVVSSHDYLLFFTTWGRVYKQKAYRIPEGSRTSKGIPVINIVPLEKGTDGKPNEELRAITVVNEFDRDDEYLLFVTRRGIVKRTKVSDYRNIRSSGIIAIGMKENDELLDVVKTDGKRQIVLGASNGKAIRFDENDISVVGRTASGVRGMSLDNDDILVGVSVIEDESQEILIVTENGYGKRTVASEYRLQSRAGKGVKTLNVTEKNGKLVSLHTITNDEDLLITTSKGNVIRISSKNIPTTGRATQGVILIDMKNNKNSNQTISAVSIIPHSEDEEETSENAE